MSKYSELKKIIPPDQALANKALGRSLQQVKGIFRAELPSLSQVVSNLESNKDLPDINSLTEPVPQVVRNYWGNTFATGTGPGNVITVSDMIGTASGNTTVAVLPELTSVVNSLESSGALDSLVANTGNPSSSNNGVYTVMSYCLAGSYTSTSGGDPEVYTVSIPSTVYFTGGSFSANTSAAAITAAFSSILIPAGNSWISNIANSSPDSAEIANNDSVAIAQQIGINVKNCTLAGIDMPGVVRDVANTDFEANSVSTLLSMTTNLHDYGVDITAGGAAEFFDAVANRSNLYGQAVISSLREGRNIELLNAVGIQLDTQLSSTSPDPKVSDNISNGQYTAAEAQARIRY